VKPCVPNNSTTIEESVATVPTAGLQICFVTSAPQSSKSGATNPTAGFQVYFFTMCNTTEQFSLLAILSAIIGVVKVFVQALVLLLNFQSQFQIFCVGL